VKSNRKKGGRRAFRAFNLKKTLWGERTKSTRGLAISLQPRADLLGGTKLTTGGIERRKSIRFPLSLETRITGRNFTAQGVTVNVSSGGVLLKMNADVPRGALVEAHVKWPAALEACDLKLVLAGPVVWKQGQLIAIRNQVHQFRTVSRKRAQALQLAAAARVP
jgi:hypothetical protein